MAAVDTQLYIAFTVFFSLSTLALLHHLFNKPSKKAAGAGRRLCLPRSPPRLLIIGHLHLMSPHIHRCFQSLAQKYGPLIYLRLGAARCVLVSSSALATEIFKTQDLVFSSRPTFAFSDELPYGSSGFFAAPYGAYWRFMKKLTMSELMAPRQMELSRDIRDKEIQRFLRKMMVSSEKGETVDLGAELMKLTNNITCTMVMSTRCSSDNDEAEKIRKLVKETVEMAAKVSFGDMFVWPFKRVGFWLYGTKARDITLKYDAILERVLKQHEERAAKEGFDREDKDLMDIILKVYYDENAEMKISRTNIKSFLLELFLGGTSTSTEVMQWTLARLINHPDVLKKLREEIFSVTGHGRLVQESDIPNLPYLQAVVKEVLRLYPAAPVAFRRCREDCQINGVDIPKDTTVTINLFAIMRDPEVWDNPNEFNPDRFFNPSNEKEGPKYEIKGQNFSYVPFGGGRRACPGSNLAYAMVNLVTAAVVQCFDWKYCGEGNDGKVNMEIGPGLSLQMAHPFLCVPITRFNPFDA